MEIAALLMTHIVARQQRKSPFFFSRFNFERMKERGNTHYCFHCGGHVGFKTGKRGKPKDHIDDSNYNPMKGHDSEHADAVIGNADKFDSVHEWLESEIAKKGAKFPYIVSVPSV